MLVIAGGQQEIFKTTGKGNVHVYKLIPYISLSLMSHTDQNNQWWLYAGPGGWNDPDIMQIGKEGMSLTEYITHFSLWALMKVPH